MSRSVEFIVLGELLLWKSFLSRPQKLQQNYKITKILSTSGNLNNFEFRIGYRNQTPSAHYNSYN